MNNKTPSVLQYYKTTDVRINLSGIRTADDDSFIAAIALNNTIVNHSELRGDNKNKTYIAIY